MFEISSPNLCCLGSELSALSLMREVRAPKIATVRPRRVIGSCEETRIRCARTEANQMTTLRCFGNRCEPPVLPTPSRPFHSVVPDTSLSAARASWLFQYCARELAGSSRTGSAVPEESTVEVYFFSLILPRELVRQEPPSLHSALFDAEHHR